jgi:hypothetical protein
MCMFVKASCSPYSALTASGGEAAGSGAMAPARLLQCHGDSGMTAPAALIQGEASRGRERGERDTGRCVVDGRGGWDLGEGVGWQMWERRLGEGVGWE